MATDLKEIHIWCPICNVVWSVHSMSSLGEHIMKAVDALITKRLKELQ